MHFCRHLQFLRFSLNVKIKNYSKSCALSQQKVMITGPLAKMINKAEKKKKVRYSAPKFMQEFADNGTETTYHRRPSEGSRRRAYHVSFVLYDYITQIINSGELCPQIATKMIEIVQVKMLPDFSAIHIYWSPSGTSRDDEVNKLLKEKENKMRALLTTYRPIAKIPQIVFQKDKHEAQLHEIDRLFEIADYGDKYVPSFKNKKNVQDEPVVYIDDTKAEQFQQIRATFDDSQTEVIHMDIRNEKISKELKDIQSEVNNKFHSSDSSNVSHSSIIDEYKDNMYGLNHTSLTKKIELWKHKIKHRKVDDSNIIDMSKFKNLESEVKIPVKLDQPSFSVVRKWQKKKVYKKDNLNYNASDFLNDMYNNEDDDSYEQNYDSDEDCP